MKNVIFWGITLVETLVVLAVLGVMLALGLPRLQSARQHGPLLAARTHGALVAQALSTWQNREAQNSQQALQTLQNLLPAAVGSTNPAGISLAGALACTGATALAPALSWPQAPHGVRCAILAPVSNDQDPTFRVYTWDDNYSNVFTNGR